MNAVILKILLFSETSEKREVSLTTGLNVITGDSKTGKSALIEIVDYCLFASRSTIPKGIINDFTELFAIVLKVSNKYITITRPNPKKGDGGKAYVRLEISDAFLLNLSAIYCTAIGAKPLKDAQEEVERHLGISIMDTRINEDEDKRNAGKVSLRSFVPFLFQHQNLIANKHSLFYRFDDFYKRKKTIDDFPVLIGWESSEYFLLLRELETKKRTLKAEEKLINKSILQDEQLLEQLTAIISSYYKYLGLELGEGLSLAELVKVSKNLPTITANTYADSNLKLEIEEKAKQLRILQDELSDKLLLLSQLSINIGSSNNYAEYLDHFKMTNSERTDFNDNSCPLCKNQTPIATMAVEAVRASYKELVAEFSKIGTYSDDCADQIELLQKERDKLKGKIKEIATDIDTMERQDKAVREGSSFREQAFILKGATESNIQHLLHQNGLTKSTPDLDELRNRIAWLEDKVKGFDLKSKIKDAESFLSVRMTEICNKLDFENELKPGTLRFSLTDFNFYYHYNDREMIYLSEMGSGANWLSCHLSLFISLLHLNCKSSKSSIPTFLMLDQPSQVYFPREYRHLDGEDAGNVDENIAQVKNIFNVLNSEIIKISADCGFGPQIIVMDHADEHEFSDSVKARWKKIGNKLI